MDGKAKAIRNDTYVRTKCFSLTKAKKNVKGEIERYKTRLIVKGYKQ